MDRYELSGLQLIEKGVYLKAMLDKNTPSITEGACLMTVNRESLV
jgi:hypothetical protein